MTLGQVVDYCVEYNKMHDYESVQSGKTKSLNTDTRRKANQSDWDAFWG